MIRQISSSLAPKPKHQTAQGPRVGATVPPTLFEPSMKPTKAVPNTMVTDTVYSRTWRGHSEAATWKQLSSPRLLLADPE
jgi:hypothetical protein